MKRLLVVLCLLGALWASPAADASTPIPWCGTDVVATDRQPDLNPGFDVHVIYAHAPGSPDRFLEWAPRIAGDVAAIDAWWRTQDAGRAPRFDLSAFPCSSVFGAIDISRVSLTADVGPVAVAFENLRDTLSDSFTVVEKAYLVYYDGNTGQSGLERTCGQGAEPGRSIPGFAVVFLDSCSAESKDTLRPVVAVHELVHVLGRRRQRRATPLQRRPRLRRRERSSRREAPRQRARDARARRRPRRLLRPLRIVAGRAGLALPRAARLTRPHPTLDARAPQREGAGVGRERSPVLGGFVGRPRPRCVPDHARRPVRGDRAHDHARLPERHRADHEALHPGRRLGRTPQSDRGALLQGRPRRRRRAGQAAARHRQAAGSERCERRSAQQACRRPLVAGSARPRRAARLSRPHRDAHADRQDSRR